MILSDHGFDLVENYVEIGYVIEKLVPKKQTKGLLFILSLIMEFKTILLSIIPNVSLPLVNSLGRFILPHLQKHGAQVKDNFIVSSLTELETSFSLVQPYQNRS